MDLSISLALESGKTETNCLKPLGISSVEKNVLQRNDIGTIINDVYLGASV